MTIKDRLLDLRTDEKKRKAELAAFQQNLARQEQLKQRTIERRYRSLEKLAEQNLYPILAGVQAGYLGHDMGKITRLRAGTPEMPEVIISLAWGEQQDGDIQLGWRRGQLIKISVDELNYRVYASTHKVAQVSRGRLGWQSKIENAILASLAKGQTRWSEAWDRRVGPKHVREDKPGG